MRFKNREDAARRLALRLERHSGQRPLVLGVPRGAVPMARIIGDALDGDVDVELVRKLRAPGQPELALGAVDEYGGVVEGHYFNIASEEYIRAERHTQLEILHKRRVLYTRTRPAIDPADRVVIIVDDGVATGSSMLAAITSVRTRNPRCIIVAVAVAPPPALVQLRGQADEVVCLHSPDRFYAVSQSFEDFSEVTDEMVVAALAQPPK